MLTVGEIKRTICAHTRLAPAEPSEQRTTGGNWQTKLTCPACGAWTMHDTPANAVLTAATIEHTGGTPDDPAWERCVVELRCQERQARTYPLCRFEAVADGLMGRALIGSSAEFDNGIERAERQALLDAFAADLLRDRWQAEPPATDGMPRFRRPVNATIPAVRT